MRLSTASVACAWFLIFASSSVAQLTQQGPKLVGADTTSAAQQGYSVALSADGNTALVGGPKDAATSGAEWVFTRSGGTWDAGRKLVGTGVGGQTLQGFSVGLSGDGGTAIVGVYQDAGGLGAALVFVRRGDDWEQQSKLVGTDAVGAAGQGASVSISADGNTAVVGGSGDNAGAGATWVFTRVGSQWAQQGSKLVGTGAAGAAGQGGSVSLSADGNTVVVGGSRDNGYTGAVWVFTRSESTWLQQGSKLVGGNAIGRALEGASVAVSADGASLIVGGPGDASQTGSAWFFTLGGAGWRQQGGKLTPTGATASPYFGSSVSLSGGGGAAVVGGFNDGNGVGAAWVYSRTAEGLSQLGKLAAAGAVGKSNEGFSVAVSSDGGTIAVGGPTDSSMRGAAWIFTRAGSIWTQESKLVGAGGLGVSALGAGVALSADGNTALVGGPNDNAGAGAAWVFVREAGLWTQQGSKLAGIGGVPGSGSAQGASVALSADGNTAIVGGPGDASGVGAAWIFTRAGGAWNQQGGKLVGSSDPARAGTAVALSADGNTALVGAPAYSSTGGAWVFTRSGGSWSRQGGLLVGSEGGEAGSRQGLSVAISADGNTAIIGGDPGDAWVFTRSDGVWTQQGGRLDVPPTVPNASGPTAVALSGDGSTAVLGTCTDSSSEGSVVVFTRADDVWSEQGGLTASDVRGVADFGCSVGLSSDGNTALVGGPFENGRNGAAWMFTRVGSTWSQTGARLVGSDTTRGAEVGRAVALASDAHTAILGAGGDNGGVGAALVFARGGPCTSGPTTLCVDDAPGDRRFEVRASFHTVQGGGLSGDGRSIDLSSLGVTHGGLFWFFDATNPEMVVKVVNGCVVNDRFWVFYSAGTNVGLSVTVTDTTSGLSRSYTNADLAPAVPVEDTNAFACGGARTRSVLAVDPDLEDVATLSSAPRDLATSVVCVGDAHDLCIANRFRVGVTYRTSQGGGRSGSAVAIPLDPVGVTRGGLFWFFGADNPEMLIKVIDGCAVNHQYWVFYAAGTNVGLETTVTDTLTGRSKTYANPDLTSAPPVQDVAAFPCE